MTNTQSPAPGVAAEREQFEAWYDAQFIGHAGFANRHRLNESYCTPELENRWKGWLARATLQASAAAVEPVGAMLIEDGRFNGFDYHKERNLPDGEYDLYTAPLLPAQVQEAEVSDALILEALAEQDVFLIHHQPGEDDRIPESGMFSDVALADMRKAFAYIASRAPAPGMAGGVAPDYGTYTTDSGDSLMGIALRQLKDEKRWREIAWLNADEFPGIGPHDYYPVGTELRMPPLAAPHPAPAQQAAGRPTEPGVYAWVPDYGSPSLVLVGKRPTNHCAGGILNGQVIESSKFYDGCAMTSWPEKGWVSLASTATGRAGS